MKLYVQKGNATRSDLFPAVTTGGRTFLAENASEAAIMLKYSKRWGENLKPETLDINLLERNDAAVVSSYIEFFGNISPKQYANNYFEGYV